LKAAVIGQQLRRLAGIDMAVTVEPLPGDGPDGEPDHELITARGGTPGLGWRTRVQFAVRQDGVAGLRSHRSHAVIDIGDCLIAHPAIRDLDVPGHDWSGAATVEAEAGTQECSVIVTYDDPPRGGRSRQAHQARGRGRQAGRRRTQVEGRPYLTQRAAGRWWQVGVGGFWQVHPAAADALADAVRDALEPKPGDSALDLYCGAGLFAGVLAPLVGPEGSVTGIESDAAAVKDARQNLADFPWVRVHQADVTTDLNEAVDELPAPPGLVVADPPRSGLAREVVAFLIGASSVTRFAYVSCDPATLARDLALLTAGGWTLAGLRAFDAFPMTHHVECVAALTR
jgi:tRNA/tmRNA/rRNA uracil-C5-methylase (TrmA/RlmC/RlmD family)